MYEKTYSLLAVKGLSHKVLNVNLTKNESI